MVRSIAVAIVVTCSIAAARADAQTAANLSALRGLAPVAALLKSEKGKAALDANLKITREIQMGALGRPLLMTFLEQQQQALRDCFITDGNATELADGLGTVLAKAYQAKAVYSDATAFTSVSQPVGDLIGYTNNIAKADSNSAKYFFANATIGGKLAVSDEARAILTAIGGTTDVFGLAYDLRGGSSGAGAYGNSRPFQTEPRLLSFRGTDYFGRPSNSLDWLRGPMTNLTDSPSYPSGHTTYGYTEAVLLAILVPERYQQMVTRAAEYGNDRIIMGAHYAMDVLGGRATALHAVAHLLSNDPAYVGPVRTNPAIVGSAERSTKARIVISNFPKALAAARGALRSYLEDACRASIEVCAEADDGRFKNAVADMALYDATQTYGLPTVHPETAGRMEDVGAIAPEAGYLLTAAYPTLSLPEADAILTSTEGPGGGFLDDRSDFCISSRINLFAAAGQAAKIVTEKRAKSATTR